MAGVCLLEELDTEQQPLLAHILQHSVVVTAYDLAQPFIYLVREQRATALINWLERSHASSIMDLRQFAPGLQKEFAAILAAINLPRSSGPVQSNVTRLKLLKRQMYERAHLELGRIGMLGEI